MARVIAGFSEYNELRKINMSSLAFMQERNLGIQGTIGQMTDDGPVALRLRYIGSGTVTSVIVTTATDITMITSDGGTDAYTWGAYTTLGALADKINTDGIFEAKILDSLRTTATGNGLHVAGTLAISTDGYYDMLSDTSNADLLAWRLTYDRTFGKNSKLRDGHRVHIQSIVTNLTLGGGADTNGLKIYECKPSSRGSIETLIYQATPTSGAEATITWASGEGKITAGDGNDLVVYITDATSVTGTLTVVGQLE